MRTSFVLSKKDPFTLSKYHNVFRTCGMMDNLLLKSLSPRSLMSTPSISILPRGSAKRNNVERRDDFPAPVRPTTPI